MGVIRNQRERLLQARARRLRRADTDAEGRLWQVLRHRRLGGWKWRRQVPIGPFIADFACREARLVVELDGGQHSDRTEYDARRTAHLEALGFRVIRFWNSEVLTNRHGVCLTILDACGGDAPLPRQRERLGEGRRVRTVPRRMRARGPSTYNPEPAQPALTLPSPAQGAGEERGALTS